MPTTALKHLAKRGKVSIDRAEHLWKKAKGIVRDEYKVSEDDPSFWALTTGVVKKMLGLSESMTFKQYLQEASVGFEPAYNAGELTALVDIVRDNCKDSIWMIKENKPIWRGSLDTSFEGAGAVVDTTATQRRSQNTSNHYTVIFDNHPDRKDFPKRSRSFICSTDMQRASSYARNNNERTFAIIPFDGAKIGAVNSKDMWDTVIDLFARSEDIETFNEYWDQLDIEPTIESFEEFGKRLKDGYRDDQTKFVSAFPYADMISASEDFMGEIWKAYSAKSTGHTAYTTSTFSHIPQSEVWVGGKVVMIKKSEWAEFKKAFS